MSKENVEVVREAFDAALRGDWAVASAAFDPSVEWVEMPSLGPDASTYHGIEELRGAIQSWLGNWGEYAADVARYADSGDDVVILIRERAQGGVSGAAVERELGEVVTLREAKIVRVRLYGDWAEALGAAGLSE
ncbi:MAG TPA: nuclear transport factor 2 family protein [Solirubrobacterales bacterium]|jgi:ketosteroid isomerase-like protein